MSIRKYVTYLHDHHGGFVFQLVPDYYNVITNPMDFMKIRQKLSRQHFNHYDIVEEFLADVRLIFDNCAKYNAVSIR